MAADPEHQPSAPEPGAQPPPPAGAGVDDAHPTPVPAPAEEPVVDADSGSPRGAAPGADTPHSGSSPVPRGPLDEPSDLAAPASPATAGRGAWWRNAQSRAARFMTPVPERTSSAPPPLVDPGAHPPLLRQSPFAFGFFGALGAVVAYFLFQIAGSLQGIILTVIVALFIALGLNPLVERLERWRLPRGLAVVIVMLLLVGVVALGGWALFPVLGQQVRTLIENTPAYLQWLRQNETFATLDQRFQIVRQVNEFLASRDTWTNMFGGLLGAGRFIANTFVSTIIAIVLTLYFLATLPAIKQSVYRLAPASRRPRARYLADETFRRVGGYLSGMFVVVTIDAICAFIMMEFVGLQNYALALAFVVALFAFIPLVGNYCSMVIIALMALPISPVAAIAVVVYYLIYMQIDAYVLQPRIMARSVKVPGAVTIVAALAGGTLLGVIGAIIAIPTAAVLLLLYREVVLPKLDAM